MHSTPEHLSRPQSKILGVHFEVPTAESKAGSHSMLNNYLTMKTQSTASNLYHPKTQNLTADTRSNAMQSSVKYSSSKEPRYNMIIKVVNKSRQTRPGTAILPSQENNKDLNPSLPEKKIEVTRLTGNSTSNSNTLRSKYDSKKYLKQARKNLHYTLSNIQEQAATT